jgi:hypothetical protein
MVGFGWIPLSVDAGNNDGSSPVYFRMVSSSLFISIRTDGLLLALCRPEWTSVRRTSLSGGMNSSSDTVHLPPPSNLSSFVSTGSIEVAWDA